ncbi:hypothetical protein H5410_040664 [Solanum commersonii]|uniref:Uncharacterized protein n=1 Tax=Solanum commersonii TaxID=4109 RepID=A0A9J5XT75_SOLCO|nr:hypothetical protein H5410_040664 [Solanum commersonii]
MEISLLSNRNIRDMLYHLLVYLHEGTGVSSTIRVRRISELSLHSLKLVWHKEEIGLLHVLSVVGTTQEGVTMALQVVSNLGASLSFVTPYVAMNFDVLLEKHLEPFSVSTPVGESILAERFYRDCIIDVNQKSTMTGLVELDMVDFDVISLSGGIV